MRQTDFFLAFCGDGLNKKAAAQVLSSSVFPTSRTSFQLKIVCMVPDFAVQIRRHDRAYTRLKRHEPAEKFQKSVIIFDDTGLSPFLRKARGRRLMLRGEPSAPGLFRSCLHGFLIEKLVLPGKA
jgi:hypothetical protein